MDERWQQLYERQRGAAEKNWGSLNRQVSDVEEFQTQVDKLSQEYPKRNVHSILRKFAFDLSLFSSFVSAIKASSQLESFGTLLWEAQLASIEAACNYDQQLEAGIEMLSNFNNSLPLFDDYLPAIPNETRLQQPLSEMCDAYMDFCFALSKYLKRRARWEWRLIWRLSPSKLSQNYKKRLENSKASFLKALSFVSHTSRVVAHTRPRPIQMQRGQRGNSDLDVPTYILTPARSSPSSTGSSVRFPVFSIPAFKNHAFVGRDECFLDLDATLQLPGTPPFTNPACCVLHGLGGIGKTAMARQYAFEKQGQYDAVFEVQSDSQLGLRRGFCAIYRTLRFNSGNGDDEDAMIEEVKDWFEGTGRRWLLIYDNVEDTNDLIPYWPSNLKCRGSIIITTQKPDIPPLCELFANIPLKPLSSDDGAEAIFRYLQRDPLDDSERRVAYEISDVVGGLPLTLKAVGGYLNGSTIVTLAEFLKEFNKSSRFWQSKSDSAYERNLSTVFDIAIQELDEEPRILLHVLSFCNPDGIPQDFLRADVQNRSLAFLREDDKAGLIDALGQLQRRQLVTAGTPDDRGVNQIAIHRSLQWVIRHQLNANLYERKTTFDRVLHLVFRVFPQWDPLVPFDATDPNTFGPYEKYLSQLLSVFRSAQEPHPAIDENKDFAAILGQAGVYMWRNGLLKDCRDVTERAETVLKACGVTELDPRFADISSTLAILCTFEGVSRRQEGIDRSIRVLQIRELVQEKFDSVPLSIEMETWSAWADLACAYLEDENFTKVEEIMDNVMAHYRAWGTELEEPFHWSRYYQHMSFVRMAQNKPLKALEWAKLAVDLQERASGTTSVMTQMYRFTLAQLLYHAEDYSQAARLLDIIATDCENLFGEFNSLSIITQFARGILCWIKQDWDQAEKSISSCLEPAKDSQWSVEHRARASYYYARLLDARGRLDEARVVESRAVEIRDRLLKQYPDVLREDPADSRVVYDLMVPMWDFRLTGRLHGKDSTPCWW